MLPVTCNLLLQLADSGKTLIVTSHILPELSRICNQVAIVTHGQLRAFGSLEDILRTVSQRRWIEVQLTCATDVDKTEQIIEQQVGIDSETTSSSAEATVRVQTSQSEEELSQLLAQLTSAGVGVSQFREIPVDLEDTFLSITRQTAESAS